MSDGFGDPLITPDARGVPEHFFDRFMFNLHPTDSTDVSLILGAGLYPRSDTIDGFLITTIGREQRNLRFSTVLDQSDGVSVGPLRWRTVEPLHTWRIAVAPNDSGVSLDVEWRARTLPWFGDVTVRDGDILVSSFEHLFQSGAYRGTLTVDGGERDVAGWYGQRDRSRGVRTLSGGQGLHLWFQAQFPDRAIGFLLVENREHGRLLLEGAVMPVGGELDPIVDVAHDLLFSDDLDLRRGRVVVKTASGGSYPLLVDASAAGGYLAGGGYGGHHGTTTGVDHVEHDRYPLDGSVTPRSLDTPLTDRLCRFVDERDGASGTGIFEFAHSRSGSYRYRATL